MKHLPTLLLAVVAIYCAGLYQQAKQLADDSERVNVTLITLHRARTAELINLSAQIAKLEADKQGMLAVLLTNQIKEDNRGYQWPNPILPPITTTKP